MSARTGVLTEFPWSLETAAEEAVECLDQRESTELEWVDTPTSARIIRLFDLARAMPLITAVYGGPGTGKTETARRYASLNESVWIASMSSAQERLRPALLKVASACRVEVYGRDTAQLHEHLVSFLGRERSLLVIDEAQHLGLEALEGLRAFHDEAECGIALLGNRVFRRRVWTSPRFEALRSRACGGGLHLEKAALEDAEALLDARGIRDTAARKAILEPANGDLRRVALGLRLAELTRLRSKGSARSGGSA